MGYMVHHAILVTSWDTEKLDTAHQAAERIVHGLVSPIVKGRINTENSFFVAPDGSKEGWDTSNEGDEQRAAFIAWLREQEWSDGSSPYAWALVQYGDDDGDQRVVEATR